MHGYHIRISLSLEAKSDASQPTHQPIQIFVPTSLFQRLPNHKPKPTSRNNALYSYKGKDYRFGPLRVDWVDFEDMSKASYANTGKEREHASGRGPATATFLPRTKSGSMNLPEGVVHVLRESATPSSNEVTEASSSSNVVADTVVESDGVMIAVLAVPSWMTPSDFLGFIAPASGGIAHLRIIRDSAPNRSIAVIKFYKAEDATEFAEAYNGKPFNSMEPEICHVVRVLSVNIDTEDTISQTISRLGSAQPSMYELPTCPVCLERMDSAVTGLITVPCSHTFHCTCLSKWGDSRCPVCRYSQTLLSSHPTSSSNRPTMPMAFASPSTPALSSCSSCSSTTNLWICLICGHIGCGRYGRAHAQAHYQETMHLYALELETQRVWDYAGDGYVHRLIQNKADGKLVELPSAAASVAASPREGGLGPGPADALSAEKIEAIGIEYSYLLTSQLDSQRSYYEDQMKEVMEQVEQLKPAMDALRQEAEEERKRWRKEEARKQREFDERLEEILKDKQRVENKAEKMTELARKLDKELRDERAVSESLMRNLAVMKERMGRFDKEKEEYDERIKEMSDQLRDVMFFLEARTRIEQGDGVEAEAAGGSVELPPVPPSAQKKKKSRKR